MTERKLETSHQDSSLESRCDVHYFRRLETNLMNLVFGQNFVNMPFPDGTILMCRGNFWSSHGFQIRQDLQTFRFPEDLRSCFLVCTTSTRQFLQLPTQCRRETSCKQLAFPATYKLMFANQVSKTRVLHVQKQQFFLYDIRISMPAEL